MWDEMANGIQKVVNEILCESKGFDLKDKDLGGGMRMFKKRLNIKESTSKFHNLITKWKIERNIS